MLDFNTINTFYIKGLWTKQLVLTAVRKGLITEEQAKEILKEEE